MVEDESEARALADRAAEQEIPGRLEFWNLSKSEGREKREFLEEQRRLGTISLPAEKWELLLKSTTGRIPPFWSASYWVHDPAYRDGITMATVVVNAETGEVKVEVADHRKLRGDENPDS